MAKIENLVFLDTRYAALTEDASREDRQMVLDEITEEVMPYLSAEEISLDVQEFYNDTAWAYRKNPHNKDIIDGLIDFMDILPEGARVLDLGCGPGRDTLFMSIADGAFRKSLMERGPKGATTLDKFLAPPTKTLRVIGVDNSRKMLVVAEEEKAVLEKHGLLVGKAAYPVFYHQNIHNLDTAYLGPFEGIWSCKAFGAHTPQEFLKPGMETITKLIRPGGALFLSYINGDAAGRYDKLLLSSTTGRIKYFSQPCPSMIALLADINGLRLEKESFSDYDYGKTKKKDLFVSQLFKKV